MTCTTNAAGCLATNSLQSGRITALQVQQGVDYYLTVGSNAVVQAGNFTLDCYPETYTRPEDECAGALVISDGSGLASTSNTSNAQTVPFNSPYRDIWYRYTATCTGRLQIQVPYDSNNYYTLIELRDASIPCTDPSSIMRVASGQTASTSVIAGTHFFLRVGTSHPFYVLNKASFLVTCDLAAPNDEPSGALRFVPSEFSPVFVSESPGFDLISLTFMSQYHWHWYFPLYFSWSD